MTTTGPGTGDAVKERVRTEKKEPKLFKVLLLNDDYTTSRRCSRNRQPRPIRS
jgi:ATP-dependent Clp protease adapter protein ClpS